MMRTIAIGIHVRAEEVCSRDTLACLRAHTSRPYELLMLPDDGCEATREAVRTWPQVEARQTRGAPACFSRLVSLADADVFVFLENGAQVGPRWLEYLLAGLDADPRNGLAGPSTNNAWNEQCVFPRTGGRPDDVARTAREAARRYGRTTRTLEPLYSLADFCYVVRREVVEAIGGADKGYEFGPCWEMDYNIRAARAGWRGVWACGAFVHRAPFTARRRLEEARRFEASKRRYQDKFCALRLRGERTDYERHCKGEECEHFAPASLIRMVMPLARNVGRAYAQATSPKPAAANPFDSVVALGGSKVERTLASEAQVEAAPPLVSCVMATRDRAEFVLQSLRYFERQDYPARELIIIDDGQESLEGKLPDDGRIRYVQLTRRQSIGAKRNLGCELARGSIIAQWDDDDWYSANRLSVQVAPLLAGRAEVSGLQAVLLFDLARWEFWLCAPALRQRMFMEDVIGGTLVYWRRVWERGARYPGSSLGEDAMFLRQAIRQGARLERTPGDGLFIYLRHGGNSWRFDCGQFLDSRGWQQMAEPPMPATDRLFYASRSAASPRFERAQGIAVPVITSEGPLVSCIMPTYNRRPYVRQALAYFLRQSYTNAELIIVDDGSDAIGDLIPADPRVRYIRLAARATIGAKRNLACEQARGELIVHWDDDDWTSSWRLEYQVKSMINSGADLCGLDKPLFYDPRADRAWEYVYPRGGKFWVAGSTLCYTRPFWRENPFPNINVGEDTRFVWAGTARRMMALEDPGFFVAIIHPGNTSAKRTSDARYQAKQSAEVRNLLGDDLSFYVEMGNQP